MESTSNTGSWNGHWTYRILINVMSIKKQPPTTPKSRAVFIESSKVWPVKRHVFFEVSPLYSDISSSHFIWHSDILYLEFYLTYNYINLSLPFYLHLSAIYSDILSGDLVVILSDIFLWQFALAFYLFDILSGIPSETLSDTYSDIRSDTSSGILAGIRSGILLGIDSDFLSDILSGVLSGMSGIAV
jgi:hypothetical protein